MGRKQFIWIGALTIISGFLGGALASHLFVGQTVYASEMAFTTEEQFSSRNNITTQKIELVDKNGKMRASLGLNDEGDPSLIFYSRDSSVATILSLSSESNPTLMLQGKNGGRFNLAVGSQGNPVLLMQDQKGKIRAVLQLDSTGDPIFALQDNNDKARAILGKVSNENTTTPIPERPISSLILLDKNEKIIWKNP
jgi:hypothetical protein